MALTFGGNPQDCLPRKSVLAGRQANHDGLVTHVLELPAVGFGIIENDLDLFAGRQLLEVIPIALAVSWLAARSGKAPVRPSTARMKRI